MKRPKRAILIITITLFSILIIAIYLTQFQGIKSIDISALEMEKTQLPEKLECNWYSVNNAKWDYREQYSEEFLYMGATKDDRKSIQWVSESDNGVINVTIVNYGYPIIAKMYYSLQNPQRLYGDSYENFINSTPVNLDSWIWKNTFADQESVQCGLGDQEHCSGWFYRARYAQYFLYIRYQGPDCSETFENIVKAINKQLVSYLISE